MRNVCKSSLGMLGEQMGPGMGMGQALLSAVQYFSDIKMGFSSITTGGKEPGQSWASAGPETAHLWTLFQAEQ